MIDIPFVCRGLLVVLLAVPVAVVADTDGLLARIQQASRSLDYDGIFVYQRGDQLDSLRVVHKASAAGVRERLVSLNGAPREIIRSDREVQCYLSDEDAVLIEHRRADQRNFPALLPESLSSLKRNYKIRIGAEGRVAGRRTRAVVIKPRDELRYGYQLWADKATGLLLSAGLVDERGTLIEQYMFTQISIGLPIPDDELKPQTPAGKLVRRPPDAQEVAAAPSRWTAGELPAGFALTARMWRAPQGSRAPMEHLVYSDGLAVVSVFIEPLVESDQNEPLGGITRIGAMHIYGRSTDGHQVTVMGEVPAATVSMVGDSVRLQP